MLRKRQIRAFKFNVFVALLLGFATIFPFRTLPIENGYELDILLKGFIFPLTIILLSIKANVIKYRELQDCRLRSKVANLMSYIPVLIYVLALLASTFHTLTIGIEKEVVAVLDPLTYSVLVTLILALALTIIIGTNFVNRIVLNANKNKLIAIDGVVVTVLLLTLAVFYSINSVYHTALNGEALYHKGNVVLLVILAVGFISLFRLHTKVKRVFNENETHISMNVSEVLNYEPSVETKNAEYRRAFKQIKQEFATFLIKESEKATELPQENESDVQEKENETLEKE